jgi:fibronectin-binding autotransporter adhesin
MVWDTDSFAVFSNAPGRHRSKGSITGRYRGATALAGGLAAMILVAAPAAAQTHGGAGGRGNTNDTPPAGGTTSDTGAGGNGGDNATTFQGGGGGGAGAVGGNGGASTGHAAGGTGGSTSGREGAPGTSDGYYASGGGGGAHGAVLTTTVTPGTDIAGGRGGIGGTAPGGDGGGGGAGGYGVVVATTGSFVFSHTITGGNGGAGGRGDFFGGSGGDGGYGLRFTGGATATINAAVTGGDGGALGASTSLNYPGAPGAGGIGIIGDNLTLTLNSAVSGGTWGDGSTRAASLRLGGASTLTLGAGASLTGGIQIAGGNLNFLQNTNVTLANVISGTGSLTKSGTGILTLSGVNSYSGTTTINGGTLRFGSADAIAPTIITLNGGALDIAGFDVARSIRGSGAVVASGGGHLVFDYTGSGLGGSASFGSAGGAINSAVPFTIGTRMALFLYGSGNNLTGRFDVSGELGIAENGASGTAIIRLADAATLSTYNCGCALQVGNAIEVAAGGTATIDGGLGAVELNAAISGGNVHFVATPAGGGTFTLAAANSYGETGIGANVAVIVRGGTLGTGNVRFDAAASNAGTPATLAFQKGTDYSFGGAITGAGVITVQNTGNARLTLTGSNTATDNFTGVVHVASGQLVIAGAFGDMVGNMAALTLTGGTLGGSGTFHGDVMLGAATLAPGNSPGTLSIAGDLTLGAATILNFELGEPGVSGGVANDLVNVAGNLTLDGTLNVSASGAGYGPGYYRLFNYGGTLADNGVAIGTIAGGAPATVTTNIAGQVNLRLGGAQILQYWDGADLTGASSATTGNGGAGTWSSGSTNWADPARYAINDSWRGQAAVFAGAAGGTVTVAGTQSFEELRFQTDGYQLRPADPAAALQTTGGFSIVDVAAGTTADIGVVINGAGGLDKTGTGALLLSAQNGYQGTTDIVAGTLRYGVDDAISTASSINVSAGATLDFGDHLVRAGALGGAGAVTLGANGQLTFGLNGATTSFGGSLTGGRSIDSNGSGTFTLAGSVTMSLGSPGVPTTFAVDSGTVGVSGTGSLTADLVENHATLTNAGTITAGSVQNFASLTNSGAIVGVARNFASLINSAAGVVQSLSNDSGTTTNAGTIDGSAVNFATLVSTGIINGLLANYGAVQLQGQLNGTIENRSSSASVTLTGSVTGIGLYHGDAGASGAVFDLAGFDTQVGGISGQGEIRLGSATLTLGSIVPGARFDGRISGSGGLVKAGSGLLTLGGASSYAGATVITGGTLQLAEGGTLGTGGVTNDAMLAFDGATDRTFANTVSGSGALTKTGTNALTLTGANSYGGGTLVSAGTLAFGNGQALGTGTIELGDGTSLRNAQGGFAVTLANDIAVATPGAATLAGVNGAGTTLAGQITGGDVTFAVSGGGTTAFTLTGGNSHGETQIGAGASLVLAGGGTLGTGNTQLDGASSLTFANGASYGYGGAISGGGSLVIDTGPGIAVTLTGSNTAGSAFTGTVTLDSGKLVLDGDFGDVTNNDAEFVLRGGALGGSGTFHGDMAVTSGTLAPGNSPGTLTIAGNLTLGAATLLNYELSQAGTPGGGGNDLIQVGGNLTLDGTLNVSALAGFSAGYYRLFDYGGALSDNGLAFGSLPVGYAGTLLTNIAGQVNILFADSPQAIQYWDGNDLTGASATPGGDGGTGLWSATSGNWTAPAGWGVNDSWRGQVAVFGGAAGGAVTVQGVQAFQELRFTTGGYQIGGASSAEGLTTTGGFSVVEVAPGADARIDAAISGTAGLTKTGAGTLILGGASSYIGLTTVNAGTLALATTGSLAGAVQNDAAFTNAGEVAGRVTNTGTLVSTGTLAGALDNQGAASIAGTLRGAVANSGTIGLTGTTSGIGAVTQAAGGSFSLNGFDTSFGSLAGAGILSLGSATLTLGSDNGSTSFTGTISGSGGLAKSGTGTFSLTGASTYTGGTTVTAGTLQLGGTGALAGAVRNDATFINAGTVAGQLTSSGTLVSTGKLGGGLVNEGDATVSGTLNGAVANSGTIDLGGTVTGIGAVTQAAAGIFRLDGHDTSFGSLAGAGSVNLGSALLTIGGDNGSTSFAGVISGSGGLTKTGTGTLMLDGANSFTGLTTVAGGTLEVNAAGSIAGNVRNQASLINAGTVSGMVQNDAVLATTGTLSGGLLNNGSATLSGAVGTGVVNNGTVTFNGAATVAALQQSAAGTSNVAGAAVSLGAIVGSGTVTLGSGGTLTIGVGNANSSFAGALSGAGALAKAGSGTLVLTGAATQTGGTTIAGGTLQIGMGGTTGSIQGAIANDGVLVLSRSDAVTFGNAMSGMGGFVQAGAGTTTLTGANSYAGGTLVSAGRLRGDTASLQGAIRIDSVLEFAQAGAGTYGGSLSGAGVLEKSGAGLLSMTGDSAAFTGATNLLAGRLAVNGSLSHSVVTVASGTMIGGVGTVGGLVVQGGGTLAPGNSVGTLSVAGNVAFQAGSLLAAEVQAGGSDRLQTTGTAQLGGTLQVINLGGPYAINSSYVLVHADAGIAGTFSVTDLASFGLAIKPSIVYTANEVQLFLAPNQLSGVLGTGVAVTGNQQSTLSRIDASVLAGYDPSAIGALYGLAPAAIPAALDALSGEVYADATRATLEDERVVRDAVLGRLGEAADLGLSGNSIWGQVIGNWGSVDGDGNAAGFDIDRTGMAMGIDNGEADEEGSWRAGVMGHYTRITVSASARGSHATIDRTGGGVYAGAATGALRIQVGASLSLLDLKARRDIAIPGAAGTARGKTHGTMLQTFGQLGYRIETGAGSFVEPYLAGSVSRVKFDTLGERGGPAPLLVRDQKDVLGIAELGVRGDIGLAGILRLNGNIGLRTAFGDRGADPRIAFLGMPSVASAVHSPAIDRLAGAANLNLVVGVSDTFALRLGYTGVQGSGSREHGGRAALSLKF